jgi:hypothetical protein
MASSGSIPRWISTRPDTSDARFIPARQCTRTWYPASISPLMNRATERTVRGSLNSPSSIGQYRYTSPILRWGTTGSMSPSRSIRALMSTWCPSPSVKMRLSGVGDWYRPEAIS